MEAVRGNIERGRRSDVGLTYENRIRVEEVGFEAGS